MKNDVLTAIEDREAYLMAVEAMAGAKPSFTEDEKEKLLSVYRKDAGNRFGVEEETAVKSLLVLDTAAEKGDPATSPMADILNGEDLTALAVLVEIAAFRAWNWNSEKVRQAQELVLAGGANQTLTLAIARAALDVYIEQGDIAPYREDVKGLAELLKQADKEMFHDASVLLVRVRERVR